MGFRVATRPNNTPHADGADPPKHTGCNMEFRCYGGLMPAHAQHGNGRKSLYRVDKLLDLAELVHHKLIVAKHDSPGVPIIRELLQVVYETTLKTEELE